MNVIDLSSNNHPNNAPINWRAVAASGLVDAVIIKATQSLDYQNKPWYAADLAGAASVKLPALAYHYTTMSNPPEAEAAYFASFAGPQYAAALDLETLTNATWATAFLNALPKPPSQRLLYGSESTFPHGCPALSWIAAYGSTAPSQANLWQKTDSATIPGIPGPVDSSLWLGTPTAFATLFSIAPPEPVSEDQVVYGTIKWLVNGVATDVPAIFYPAITSQKPTVNVQTAPPSASNPFGTWEWADMTNAEVTINGTPPAVAIA